MSVFYESVSNLFIFGLLIYFIFSSIFLIDYKNSTNISRVERLFEIAFSKDLNKCIKNIREFLSYNIEDINIENLIILFDQWYSYYIGNYFEKKELNNILFDFHDIYINLKDEEYFYDLFLGVKTRLHDIYISNSNPEKMKLKSILDSKIDNYLKLLDYKIEVKVREKEEGERQWRHFSILFSILGTLVAIISTIFLS